MPPAPTTSLRVLHLLIVLLPLTMLHLLPGGHAHQRRLFRRDRAARAWPEAHRLHRGPDLLRGSLSKYSHSKYSTASIVAWTFCEAHELHPLIARCTPAYLLRGPRATSSPRTQAATLESALACEAATLEYVSELRLQP